MNPETWFPTGQLGKSMSIADVQPGNVLLLGNHHLQGEYFTVTAITGDMVETRCGHRVICRGCALYNTIHGREKGYLSLGQHRAAFTFTELAEAWIFPSLQDID